MKLKLKPRTKLEISVLVGSFLIGTMFYAYLVGTPLPNLYTAFFTHDLLTAQCQAKGFSDCLTNPQGSTCFSGYVNSGGTCTLVHSGNTPQSSIGNNVCPYGTIKDSNGQCVSAIATTSTTCPSGQTNVGGYCISNDRANFGEIPVVSTIASNKCIFTYNLIAMALTGTPTVCNPVSGDTSNALGQFNPSIPTCNDGYHYATDLKECVKNGGITTTGGGGNSNPTTPKCQDPNTVYDPTSGVCINPNTNPPQGNGINGNTTGTPFDTGSTVGQQSSSSGSSSDSVNQLAALLASYLAQQQALNNQPKTTTPQDPLSTFISQNPMTVLFIVVAIMGIIIIPKLIKSKNR